MRITALCLLSLLTACASDAQNPSTDAGSGDTAGDTDAGSGQDAGQLPEPICSAGTRWEPGTAIYREITDTAGLQDAGAVGTRINVADFNDDGWADLLVRRGGTRFEDFAAGGTRSTWLLRNDQGTFVDVTLDSGISDTRGAYEGELGRPIDVPAFADVDNDGDLDVYTGIATADPLAVGIETSELMLNNGGVFGFTRASNPVRRQGEVDAPAGASFVDFDRDGNVDLWLGQHNYTAANGDIVFQQDHLLRGLGDGTFEDVTESVGLTTLDWENVDDLNAARAHSRAWSTVACDLNNDGDSELLAASYGRAPNHLWQAVRTQAGVAFENRSVASGYAFDEDQSWQDNQFARCYCASNRDADGCADVPEPVVTCSPNWQHSQDREAFRLGGNSGTTVCADLNNDQHLDLITTEIRHWWAGEGADHSDVLFNTGDLDVTLERPGRDAIGMEVPHVTDGGWDEGHMTADAFDFDNDGWLDFYIGGSDYAGNRGLLYHQVSPGQFELVSTDDSFEHNRSHGVAHADFDRDGDLDLIVGHSSARCDATAPNNCYPTQQVRLFENLLGDHGNWLQLDLEGAAGTNRAAIGARITVTAGGVTQTHEIGGGHGHYGAQNDRIAHFGLGSACTATVTVRWPDAALSTQTFELPAGYRFAIAQGQDPVVAP